jgi:hypothetical protein
MLNLWAGIQYDELSLQGVARIYNSYMMNMNFDFGLNFITKISQVMTTVSLVSLELKMLHEGLALIKHV